ncbi:MAG TPA: hypothetical protein VLF89_08290 [Candidatus Saccharimonadales bacterium]|nr:hypothetical protein [Candidatus Saccharimonadales bacterium]
MIELPQEAIKRARNLIIKSAIQEDVDRKIAHISAMSPSDRITALNRLYPSAEHEAELGNTPQIALIQLLCEHFGIEPHTRMLLHYYAQAEANRGKKLIQQDSKDEQKQQQVLEILRNVSDILVILSNISKAFADADEINDSNS